MYKSLTAAALIAFAGAASADEISDALSAALKAYEDGDVAYALEELDFAKAKLGALKSDALFGYLPPAPEGWTREDDKEAGAGMAMFGGGTAAEATYTSADGAQSYTISMMADSPMVAQMSALMTNAAVMGMEVMRIGRQKFAKNDGEITGLVANRILVRAEGDDADLLVKALEQIDYGKLTQFGM